MTEPDTLTTIVGFIVGVVALLAAWKGKGIQHGIMPPRNAPMYPLSRVGRICLFLIGLVLLVDAIIELLKRFSLT